MLSGWLAPAAILIRTTAAVDKCSNVAEPTVTSFFTEIFSLEEKKNVSVHIKRKRERVKLGHLNF